MPGAPPVPRPIAAATADQVPDVSPAVHADQAAVPDFIPLVPSPTPSVDQLDKVQRHVESLALRTTDMLESIGFNSPDALTEAKTILWSGLPDLTAADIQALKTRRVDRSAAAAEMTTEWD